MGLFDFLKKKEFQEIEDLRKQLEKYKPISNIETEIENQKKSLQNIISTKETELDNLIKNKNLEAKEIDDKFSKLKTDYKESLETYKKLRKEVSLYENKLDLIEFGVYEPIYDFEKSDDYRAEQNKIIEKQKALISSEQAAICSTQWTVDGSLTKGKANTKKYIKLTLRAFNGECDTFIAKVKWNNVNQMKERIYKSFEAINKLGENQTVSIQRKYLDLKVKELLLEYEFQQKKQQEREELRAIQEELREEEKAKREFEQAQKEAEKEELNYQKALEKARKEIELATGEKYDKLQSQIEKLELELKEAQKKKERAMSMAQQTKRGHVYIISNIGSFGENVYKIGMTRRLEPTDRVKELGDASVPFQFDIHAMIYSEEAPTLENELHKAFTDKKVNMLNYRKEFFNVSINEIEEKVKEIGIEAEFTRLPEAMQYRETLTILESLKKQNETEHKKTIEDLIAEEFPSSLE
ncbi:DUF4041 domain-containing protein [Flavobacterium sp. SUN046]|uniref:DUF4041 domain-containing protein n=1 Tax=Flavobacterium sp. SUN046 TaxID=3002440 RepID=UPI002DB85959|nr:DUF4041 domain-containing protein [Flavobacterium sp. SUN046]MEC4048848.1 DUF4041 domain-containing protein [Flavobacterium sp. SUN046]